MKFVHILVLIVLIGIGLLWFSSLKPEQNERSAISDAINATKIAATEAVEATANAIESATESVPQLEQEVAEMTEPVSETMTEIVEQQSGNLDNQIEYTNVTEAKSVGELREPVTGDIESLALEIRSRPTDVIETRTDSAGEVVPTAAGITPTAAEIDGIPPTATRTVTTVVVPPAGIESPTTISSSQVAVADSQISEVGAENDPSERIENLAPQIDEQLKQIDAATNAINDEVEVDGTGDVLDSTEPQPVQ